MVNSVPRAVVTSALLVGLAMSTAACERSKDERGSGPAPATARAACEALADDLAAQLGKANLAPAILDDADPMELLPRADLPPLANRPAPRVLVRADGVEIDDARVPPAELERALRRLHERWRPSRAASAGGSADDDSARVLLAIDPAAPWSSVVAVLEALAASGFTAPELAFAAPTPAVEGPPRAPIDAWLDRLAAEVEPSDRATTIAKRMSELLQSCPAALDPPCPRDEPLAPCMARELPRALRGCDCRTFDYPDVRAILWRMLHNPRPATALPLDLAAAADPAQVTRVTAPGTAPWREVAPQFTKDVRAVHVAVAGAE